jgi:ribosomal protein L11 methylase PrmA
MKPGNGILGSSFRDPSGFVFHRDGTLYRQVNLSYKEEYDLLMESGLYAALSASGSLISHSESDIASEIPETAYKILKPDPIGFVSYPYEWCFSQLKDAALKTLEIQRKCMEFNLSLKDCSAYNIQFINGKPLFIDTLSFEKYREGMPWVAYQQFCRHFLAPLALMSHTDIRLNQVFRVYIDGIPLDLASTLLPFSTRLNFPIFIHVHMHSKAQKRYEGVAKKKSTLPMSRRSFLGILDSLEKCIEKLRWAPGQTQWGDYYGQTNYDDASFDEKRNIVGSFVDRIQPVCAWDLGANTGVFSKIVAQKKIPTLSFDMDPVAVEKNYRECKATGETDILPLLMDLTNPSPSLGWRHAERMSFMERKSDNMLVMALALIHHLAISNNLPFEKIASFFSELCRFLIIEFVPKDDSQVKRMLTTREDIFIHYHQDSFETAFTRFFTIVEKVRITGLERVLYLMEKTTPEQFKSVNAA